MCLKLPYQKLLLLFFCSIIGVNISYALPNAAFFNESLSTSTSIFPETKLSNTLSSLTVSAEVENVKCYEENTGSISLNISGGEAPYTISWSHNPNISQANLSNLAAGEYTVTISDQSNGSISESFVVDEPDLLVVSIDIIQAQCAGERGIVNTIVSGGTTPYSYNWNGIDPNAATAGDHTVVISDANGCYREINYTIVVPKLLTAKANVTHALCYDSFGSVSIAIDGGLAPYAIDLKGENENEILPGTYDYTVVDANGCLINGDYTISQPEQLDISVIFAQLDCNSATGYATTFIRGGEEPYNINWFDNNPEKLAPGNYTVEVIDGNGCRYREEFSYQPTEVKVHTPTAFTPNGDGLNETFEPIINCYKSFEMIIYDRWGELVFSSKDPSIQWDGVHEGKKAEQGVYFYSLKVMDANNKLSDHNGHISLIR